MGGIDQSGPDAVLAHDQHHDRQPRQQSAAPPRLPGRRPGRARSRSRARVVPTCTRRRCWSCRPTSVPGTPGPARVRWGLAATAATSALSPAEPGCLAGERNDRRVDDGRPGDQHPNGVQDVVRAPRCHGGGDGPRGRGHQTRGRHPTGCRSHLAYCRGGLGRGATRPDGGAATSTSCRPTRVSAPAR